MISFAPATTKRIKKIEQIIKITIASRSTILVDYLICCFQSMGCAGQTRSFGLCAISIIMIWMGVPTWLLCKSFAVALERWCASWLSKTHSVHLPSASWHWIDPPLRPIMMRSAALVAIERLCPGKISFLQTDTRSFLIENCRLDTRNPSIKYLILL